jgi:HlyD family type I secretion membrane fusion protein
LFKKGLARKSRMLALQRRASELEGNRNLHLAQIARARQSMTESRMRAGELKTTMINEVVENLRAAEAERYDLEERLRAARDVLRRTEVRATIGGTVVGLAVFTSGGVAAPGDRLLDIVPSGKTLMVEARIDPRDIDVVHRGLPANVRITAFNQRDQAPIGGEVESVSADLLIDQNTGESYYLAGVALNDGGLDAKFRASLYPGMPAEVMVVTDSRTFLSYLLEPLSRSINRAFRES